MIPKEKKEGNIKIRIAGYESLSLLEKFDKTSVSTYEEASAICSENGILLKKLFSPVLVDGYKALGVIGEGPPYDAVFLFSKFFLCFSPYYESYIAKYSDIEHLGGKKISGLYKTLQISRLEKKLLVRFLMMANKIKDIASDKKNKRTTSGQRCQQSGKVQFCCPECKSKMKTGDKYCGKKLQCPRCKATIRVPEKQARQEKNVTSAVPLDSNCIDVSVATDRYISSEHLISVDPKKILFWTKKLDLTEHESIVFLHKSMTPVPKGSVLCGVIRPKIVLILTTLRLLLVACDRTDDLFQDGGDWEKVKWMGIVKSKLKSTMDIVLNGPEKEIYYPIDFSASKIKPFYVQDVVDWVESKKGGFASSVSVDTAVKKHAIQCQMRERVQVARSLGRYYEVQYVGGDLDIGRKSSLGLVLEQTCMFLCSILIGPHDILEMPYDRIKAIEAITDTERPEMMVKVLKKTGEEATIILGQGRAGSIENIYVRLLAARLEYLTEKLSGENGPDNEKHAALTDR